MMRTLLIFLSLMLVAGVASAYVQSGHLAQGKTSEQVSAGGGDDGSGTVSGVTPTPISDPVAERRHPGTNPNRPANPVPEPGTMILTSMGLIALGAAMRRQRH